MARVLITDAEQRSVLAAARALACAGHEVSAVANTRLATTNWSRACDRHYLVPDPKQDRAGYVAGLEQTLREPHDALLPGADASVVAVSEQRERLEPLTSIGLPGKDVVRKSADKVALLRVSASVGLAAPASRVCSDGGEAAAAALELGYPVILKPGSSIAISPTGFRQRPAIFAADEAGLTNAPSVIGWPFVVQRFEPVCSHLSCGGVATNEGILAPVFARFRRTWPVRSGAAAFAETVAPPPGLLERIESLMAAMGWRGIFELEVLDLGGGRYAAIDLNPRVFGWLALAIEAGANLPAVWLNVLLGRTPAADGYRVGVRYRWEDADVCHFLWQLRRGKTGAAAAVLRPRRKVVHAHFRLRDPAPLVGRLLCIASKGIAPG